MTRSKLKTPFDKCNSAHEKDKNRMKKMLDSHRKRVIAFKYQGKLVNEFIKLLLSEGRITKEELKPYFINKKKVYEQLFSNHCQG